MPAEIKKISRMTLLLTCISALVIFAAGLQVSSASRDIKVLKEYLKNAEAVQPDFERSILLYATKTEKVFEHLMALRPETEEDYVAFISTVEKTGKALSLDLNVKSVSEGQSGEGKDAVKTIAYRISFYGTADDLKNVLSAMQEMPYFIRFDQVSYRDLDSLTPEERKEPNIAVKINLFIK